MLVVKVELWPDGNGRRRRELARMEISNLSTLATYSDYAVDVLEPDGRSRRHVDAATVNHHRRDDGYWVLVRRAIHAVLLKRGVLCPNCGSVEYNDAPHSYMGIGACLSQPVVDPFEPEDI